MIIIGEKLNSSIPSSFSAMQEKDSEKLTDIIKAQKDGGASFLDVNAALCSDEAETINYIIDLIKENTDCGIMLDSPDPKILVGCIDSCENRPVIINSVTCTERFDEVVPEVRKRLDCGADISLVVLPITDLVPSTNEERRENIDAAMKKLREAGIPDERIYMDLITESIATDTEAANRFFDSLTYTKKTYPDVKTTCGLSNISFGLPERAKINQAFLSIALSLGLDSAIMNPASKDMLYAMYSAELVCGRDDFGMNYISYYRQAKEQ